MHQRVKGKRGTLVKPNKKRLILHVISKNKSTVNLKVRKLPRFAHRDGKRKKV